MEQLDASWFSVEFMVNSIEKEELDYLLEFKTGDAGAI